MWATRTQRPHVLVSACPQNANLSLFALSAAVIFASAALDTASGAAGAMGLATTEIASGSQMGLSAQSAATCKASFVMSDMHSACRQWLEELEVLDLVDSEASLHYIPTQ